LRASGIARFCHAAEGIGVRRFLRDCPTNLSGTEEHCRWAAALNLSNGSGNPHSLRLNIVSERFVKTLKRDHAMDCSAQVITVPQLPSARITMNLSAMLRNILPEGISLP
jgi:hypothetical protein